MRKFICHALLPTIAVSLMLTSGLLADGTKKSEKRKTAPTITTHEIYLDYYDFAGNVSTTDTVRVMDNTGNVNPRYFRATINIPSNATITELAMRAVMGHNYSSDADRLIMTLSRRNTIGDLVLVTTVKGNKVVGSTDYRTKRRTVSIPAGSFPYHVKVIFPGNVVTNPYMVAWVRITYTTP